MTDTDTVQQWNDAYAICENNGIEIEIIENKFRYSKNGATLGVISTINESYYFLNGYVAGMNSKQHQKRVKKTRKKKVKREAGFSITDAVSTIDLPNGFDESSEDED